MEFICNLEELRKISNNVSLATKPKNSTIPSLEGILMECKDNKLTLTGYDLSLGIIKILNVDQIKEGRTILKSQIFVEILKKLTDKTIHIITNSKNITTIKTQNTQYTIPGISEETYPLIPQINQEKKIIIKDKTLKDAIFKTLFATSTNTTQNINLCGSLFKIENENLTIISVDGYRVAISNSKIKNFNINTNFIVAAKTLNEIFKLLKEDDDSKTSIEIDKNHAVFKIDGYYIITRLLQGDFIDYNSAIPKECKTIIHTNTELLEQSLQKVSVMITQNTSVIMKIFKDKTTIECESQLGKAHDTILTKLEGDILEEIAFNNRFMLDALKHCQTDQIKIGFNGPVMPILIKPENGNDFLYLVLPIRLR